MHFLVRATARARRDDEDRLPIRLEPGRLWDDELKFTAPLTAITAAVVGVILNLALFFGYHVWWPQGFAGRFDWGSALIAASAAVCSATGATSSTSSPPARWSG
jgi:hypothetical protein